MKRTIAIVAVLGMSAALSGCFSDNKPAATPAARVAAPLWKLELQNKCTGDASQCVAGYGFTVTSDGTYIAGPTPDGKTATGKLTSEEAKDLSEKLAAVSSANADEAGSAEASTTAAASESCEALNSTDTGQLILTREGQQHVLAQTHDSQLCVTAINHQAASELHDMVSELAQRYYPVPFPNACADQTAALEGLYAKAQSCSADAECVLVDQDFNAVPPSSSQWITTDSCSAIKPLSVASIGGLGAQRAALTQAMAAVSQACGVQAPSSMSCEGVMSNAVAPRCENHVCVIPAQAPAQAPAEAPAQAPAEAPAPAPAPAAN